MKKINLSFLLFALSIVFFLIFSLSPSSVDEQGILQESFYLLLLGYACLFSGVVSLVIEFIRKK
ncbi:MAG: DUF3955 domain-containing protein [Firmicutes bacterium]|nr:DUF3955 domain-containing protein [Bacillota bacterium]